MAAFEESTSATGARPPRRLTHRIDHQHGEGRHHGPGGVLQGHAEEWRVWRPTLVRRRHGGDFGSDRRGFLARRRGFRADVQRCVAFRSLDADLRGDFRLRRSRHPVRRLALDRFAGVVRDRLPLRRLLDGDHADHDGAEHHSLPRDAHRARLEFFSWCSCERARAQDRTANRSHRLRHSCSAFSR